MANSFDTLREEVLRLRTEVNCRIEHGTDSGGHLEYVQSKLDAILTANADVERRVPEDSEPAFLVAGEHPVMPKPDKVFTGENAKARADVYASVLRDQGYKGVSVKQGLWCKL